MQQQQQQHAATGGGGVVGSPSALSAAGAGAGASAPAASDPAAAAVTIHTPNLLLQAALASTTNPSNSSEATSYLQGWTRADDGNMLGVGTSSSWHAAAELVGSFYPHMGTPRAAADDPLSSSQHGVVERAIVVHHERARLAANAGSSSASSSGGGAAGGQLSDRLLRMTASGVRTLLLTLLNGKIRHCSALPPDIVGRLLDGVWCGLSYLSTSNASHAATVGVTQGEMNQLCSTAGALAVRSQGGVSILVQNAFAGTVASAAVGGENGQHNSRRSMGTLNTIVALKVLSKIPQEASECPTRSTVDIEADMVTCVGFVMEVVGMALVTGAAATVAQGRGSMEDDGTKLALQVLGNWAEPCHITLTQLSSAAPADPTSNSAQRPSLLEALISILSQPSSRAPSASPPFDVIVAASQTLMVSVLDGADYSTPTRAAAVTELLGAIPSRGFLANPLKIATEATWEGDEAVRSLANLASTIATEEVDLVVKCTALGCLELIEILLNLQVHRVQGAALAPLESWLAIQDVPISERHPNLNTPLFGRVVEALVWRVSYPNEFVSWEEDESDMLDRQEFEDMRRLASDVLVSSYFLLRTDYVDGVISSVSSRQSSWEATESALWCLCAVSRDVVDEVKKRTEGGRLTAEKLVSLAQQLCASPLDQQHPLVKGTIALYLGVLSPIWNIHASDSILELLAYLKLSMENGTAEAAAKATRQVILGCSKSLVLIARKADRAAGEPAMPNVVTVALGGIMDSALSNGKEHSMRLVAEGCTRLCMQMRDGPLIRRSLCAVVDPIIRRSSMALEHIQAAQQQQQPDSAQIDASCSALASILGSFEEVCRFCDEPTSSSGDNATTSHPLVDALTGIWPLLTNVSASQICRTHDDTISALLAVHSALLSNASELMAPHFSGTVTLIVQLYEDQHNPAALDYVTAAVEQFAGAGSGDDVASFTELLAHVTRCTTSYLTREKRPSDCPTLIEAYFDMCRRYLLYCPQALTACSEFSNIFVLSIACLGECSGSDCRAALLFLAQIIGYKNLRVSQTTSAVLKAASATIDALIAHHGEALCKQCVSSLSGGAPQMLWPPYSECLYVLLTYLCAADGGEHLATSWMFVALEADAKRLAPETRQQIISILVGFAKDGTNMSKPRAKMLLGDYAKLCKGEATADMLVAYSL